MTPPWGNDILGQRMRGSRKSGATEAILLGGLTAIRASQYNDALAGSNGKNGENMNKPIEECSNNELLKIMKEKHDWGHSADDDYNLCEVVFEYVTKCSTDFGPLGHMRMVEAVGKAINTYSSLGVSDEAIQEDSDLAYVSRGIVASIYALAMRDCGAMLGVDGDVLEKAVHAIAAGNRAGGEVKFAFDVKALRAALQTLADMSLPTTRRRLPRTKVE
jgi:hypothetical protein